MRFGNSLLIAFVAALSICAFAPAGAQAQEPIQPPPPDYIEIGDEGTYPQNYVLRPLTLPRGTIQGDLSLQIARLSILGFTETGVALSLGGGVGITDDLQVTLSGERIGGARTGALTRGGLLNIALSPDADILDSALHARYRLLSTESFELAAELGLNIPFDTDFGFSVGAPFRLRVGEIFALDGALEFVVVFTDDTFVGLSIPVQPRVAFGSFGYGGVNTGIIAGLTDAKVLTIPLGFEAGATLQVAGVGLDAFVAFDFPLFYQSLDLGGEREGDVFTDLWTLTLGARAYIDVFGN